MFHSEPLCITDNGVKIFENFPSKIHRFHCKMRLNVYTPNFHTDVNTRNKNFNHNWDAIKVTRAKIEKWGSMSSIASLIVFFMFKVSSFQNSEYNKELVW